MLYYCCKRLLHRETTKATTLGFPPNSPPLAVDPLEENPEPASRYPHSPCFVVAEFSWAAATHRPASEKPQGKGWEKGVDELARVELLDRVDRAVQVPPRKLDSNRLRRRERVKWPAIR